MKIYEMFCLIFLFGRCNIMKVYHILLQIVIGFLLADIVTGVFHWFEDTYLD